MDILSLATGCFIQKLKYSLVYMTPKDTESKKRQVTQTNGLDQLSVVMKRRRWCAYNKQLIDSLNATPKDKISTHPFAR